MMLISATRNVETHSQGTFYFEMVGEELTYSPGNGRSNADFMDCADGIKDDLDSSFHS